MVVNDLSILRNNWDAHDWDDDSPLEATTIQERLHQWIELQVAFEWQLQQTATLFEQDRWAALIELQARLQFLSNPYIHIQNLFQSVRALKQRLLEQGIPSIVSGCVAVTVWGESLCSIISLSFPPP